METLLVQQTMHPRIKNAGRVGSTGVGVYWLRTIVGLFGVSFPISMSRNVWWNEGSRRSYSAALATAAFHAASDAAGDGEGLLNNIGPAAVSSLFAAVTFW